LHGILKCKKNKNQGYRMENEMKMMKDAHETWNKMVSNIRHRIVENWQRNKA
jgi:hypothetical protein